MHICMYDLLALHAGFGREMLGNIFDKQSGLFAVGRNKNTHTHTHTHTQLKDITNKVAICDNVALDVLKRGGKLTP